MPYDSKEFTQKVADLYAAILKENISHVRLYCDEEDALKKRLDNGSIRAITGFKDVTASMPLAIEDGHLIDVEGVARVIADSLSFSVVETVMAHETDAKGERKLGVRQLWILHVKLPVNLGAGGALINRAEANGVSVLGQVTSKIGSENKFEARTRWALAVGSGQPKQNLDIDALHEKGLANQQPDQANL